MKVIKLKLEALQPLVITDGTTEGQTHRTLEYIPGNMLLGALAGAWKEIILMPFLTIQRNLAICF